MKQIKVGILIALMLFATTITSCKKDDDGQVLPVNPTFMTAKVGGESFSSDPAQTNALFHISEKDEWFLGVQGVDKNESIIQIQIADFYSIGTYEIGEDSFPNFLGVGSYFLGGVILGFSSYDGVPKGELIVTKYNPNDRIEGTFSFYIQKIFDENSIIHISEGAFSMPVTTLEP